MNAKYLKRIILEEISYVLNEEVFGAQSFVYHGSNTKPKDFIKLLASDQFAPGLGSGSAYGRGLYTVYTYEGSNTERGTYGNYIYKFKLNLYGFICFDRDVAKLVYGKELSPGDQARLLGKKLLGQKLDEVMNFYQDADLSETTSGPAHDSSRFLTGKVKGILFTGDTDGKVAVVYDPNQLTLFAWKKIDQQTWNKIDIQAVKDFTKKSSKDFEEDKYSLQKALDNIATLPVGKRKLSGNFEIDEDAPVTSLPDGLQIDGTLRIYDYPNLSSQILPNNLKISDGLVLRSPKITKLPNNLNAGYIDAQGSGLSEIPQKISAGTIYLDDTPITQLPDNLQIRNTLTLKNTQIKELPRGLRVDGDLNLTGTKIESLPEDLIVGGDILPVEKYGPMYQEIKKKRGFFGGLKARLKSMIAEEIRNVLNEEKKYISTEVLSRYDLGEDGEEQLFSLLTSGAFTADELKKILRDLHKESHKNFMAYQTAMPGDEIEFEDDSYISPSDEDFEAEANYAEKTGGMVDDSGKPISREEWKQYYERDKKQAAANDKYGQLIMRYGKIRGVIEKAIKQI